MEKLRSGRSFKVMTFFWSSSKILNKISAQIREVQEGHYLSKRQ